MHETTPSGFQISKPCLFGSEVGLPDHDDQDLLFGCSDAQSKKPKVESSGFEETPEVWSEVLWIESADVHALPYVIPY
ncbi:hypothetical protein ACFX2I_031539 [Malus domestica]